MSTAKRKQIAGLVLATLGVAMVVIGLVGGLVPPVLTGIGFFVTTWAFLAPEEKE
jgi:uncharacterized membrane protein YbaN (DUF454 family)